MQFQDGGMPINDQINLQGAGDQYYGQGFFNDDVQYQDDNY